MPKWLNLISWVIIEILDECKTINVDWVGRQAAVKEESKVKV